MKHKLRLAGPLAALVALLAYLGLVLPARREVAALQEEFSRARSIREAVRHRLGALEAEARRSGPGAGDKVAAALSLRGGLVSCMERAGLSDVEFGFADSTASLRLRVAAVGALPGVLEALDCLVRVRPGIVPATLTVSRVAEALRVELEAVPGETDPAPGLTDLVRDPFGEGAVECIVVAAPAPASRSAEFAAPPSAPPTAPEVRLVGVMRRSGAHLAALSIRGEVVLLPVGGSAVGYTLESLDPSTGAVVRAAGGERIRLDLPD